MKTITKEELEKVFILQNDFLLKKQRKGQAFFNALEELYPDIANGIRGTEFDPFYREEKINICINKICPELKKEL